MSSDSGLSIATTNVCGHEIPLPAYWRIVELWQKGMSTEGIIQRVMNITGFSGHQTIHTIVTDIIDNQERLARSTKERKVLSIAVQSPLQIVERSGVYRSSATYRESRTTQKAVIQSNLKEARQNLQVSKMREQELCGAADGLMRSRGRLAKKLDLEERWEAEAAIDRETKRVLAERQAAKDEVAVQRRRVVEKKRDARWM